MREAEQAWHQCCLGRVHPVPASSAGLWAQRHAPSPTQSPDLIFPQVSIQLQGLLQGLGHHLLPPAQEGLLLSTGPAAQPHSQFPGSGGKERNMKQLLGSSENEAGPVLESSPPSFSPLFSPTLAPPLVS